MQIVDLATLLAFLISGGVAFFLPGWLERSEKFQQLVPNGKLFVVLAVTIATTLGAGAAQEFLTQHPIISAQIDTQLKLAIVAINVVITQMRHGANKVQALRLRGVK